MNYQMTSKTAQVMTAKALMLISVLLLTACDGGIFGTGGSMDNNDVSLIGTGSATDNVPEPPVNAIPNPEDTAGDIGATDPTSQTGIDTDDNSATPDLNTDAGMNTDGSVPPDVDTEDAPSISPTDGGADADAGADDGGTSGSMAVDGVTSINNSSLSVGDVGTFTNNTRTLSGPDAQLVVVNISSSTLNVISLDTEQNTALFEITGVAPNTSSATTAPGANATNLDIVDNNTEQVLISYTEFNVDPSTLTTLLIREEVSGINAVALVTETQTSDPGLARVRVVQGDTLGNASLESELRLQSSGDNPGGMDISLGPLSFDQPQSDYNELLAGDYELIDLANRFAPVPVTLSGGTVYTLVLTGNGPNDVLTIIDSDVQ